MVITVYLHDEILTALQHFGTLEEVANRIVDAAVNGVFDSESLEKCPPAGTNTRKYTVNITNREYIEHRNMLGAKSSKVSLRRMLYHFVNNELYFDLGWQVVNNKVGTIKDARDAKFNLLLAKVLDGLSSLYKLAKEEELVYVTTAIKELRNLNRGT